MENNVDMFVLDVSRLADTLIRSGQASPAAAATAAVQAAEDMQELADFLRSMRLIDHAICARLMVQLLHADAEQGLLLASDLASLVKLAITSMESDNAAPDQSADLAQLTASVHMIAPHLLTPHAGARPADEGPAADMLLSVDHAMRMLSEMIIAPEGDTKPGVPVSDPAKAHYEALLKEPRVSEAESRQQLALLQAVHQTLASSVLPSDSRRILGNKLHALQNWTLGLGQQRLDQVLGMPGLAGLTADSDVTAALRHLLELLTPARVVRGSCFSLTLFIDIEGCSPTPEALAEAASLTQHLGGRIEVRDEHLRIMLPSSLLRLRVVTIERDGQRFCLSWAQFIEVSELPEDAQTAQADLLGRIERPLLQITLQAGSRQYLVLATSIAPAQEAARLLCPQGLGLPAWLRGTILDKSGVFLPWVAP